MTVTSAVQKSSVLPLPLPADDRDFRLARRLRVPVWVFDIDLARIVFANESACALWNAPDEASLRARDLGFDMSITVERRLKQYQSDFLSADASFSELWTIYPDGVPKSVMVIFRGYVLPDGRMGMQCEAITEAEDQPHNLRSAEALLHTDVMIALFGRDGPALYLNPAARNSLASEDNSLPDLFVDPSDFATMNDRLDADGEYRFVTRARLSQGTRWLDISAKACSDAVTGQPAILLTAIDVTELKEARDAARHMADRDQLTDLYNRAYLQTHLARLARQKSEARCAIVFLDVDRFKFINDHHGHEVGDAVLRTIANRLRHSLRRDDLAVRLGGDEFVVLLEDVADMVDAERRAARLHLAVSQPVRTDTAVVPVTASIGVAVFSLAEFEVNEILREADISLYASKQAGRNRITFFTGEMGRAAKVRQDMEFELRRAIENREFELHYQPRLDIQTRRIVAVEGLVRWRHPTRGLIGPDEFIPVCEDSGMIEDLGRLVLDMGCRQAIAWQDAGLDINVSLNVSPRQFAGATLFEDLARFAEMPGFPRGRVELEITENVLIGDDLRICALLHDMIRLGYRIAIDDFGTGYSNLSFISRFPLTCLKIDRSFISRLPESGPVVRLILALAQQIGATVVSEGVETTEQLDWLTQQCCDQAQGFLIARPLPLAELNAFLSHRS